MKTVEIKGKLYDCKPENPDSPCHGCEFNENTIGDCFEVPPCAGIIFVLKKEEKTKW